MGFDAQHIVAPDGTPLVVLKAADYEHLLALAEDGGDRLAGEAALARIDGGDGTMPAAVLDLILDEGLTPVAAWRKYRGLTQAELARRIGLSQAWIGRIEAGGGTGTAITRRKIATALDAPLWALESQEKEQTMPTSRKPRSNKYAPLTDWLNASGIDEVVLPFDAVGRIVGKLPPSAYEYQPWWQNNRGTSQALGWRDAGYIARPDMKSATVRFVRER